ncbi:MAG TPA: EAL domain-containing protein [Candidatus Angelobacter sp.]|nr:EAL domain-containing protein [Candidatus Angelobacter sp.]
MSVSAPLRVLVADDEETLREALGDLIRTDPGLQLVAIAADAREAADMAEATRPDIALIDVRMPGGGVSAVQAIRVRSPRTRVLALSASGSPGDVLEMLRAGAAGYLVKGTAPGEVLDAVHRVAAGQSPLSPEIADSIVHGLADRLQADAAEAEARERRIALIDTLINGDALQIAFQPILELRSRQVTGVEALSRFQVLPARPPDQWFAEAAALGRGVELEVAALRQAAKHRAQLPQAWFLSVNISPAVLVSQAGQRALADLASGGLVVEVTEHAPVDDYERLAIAVRGLRQLGVRLAVDDVGAGFASLRHILKLDPQVLKLDISLCNGVSGDRARQALATALISFAHSIGAEVVAEGIETDEDLETLVELGVEFGQGWLLGRPAPPGTVARGSGGAQAQKR